MAATLSITEDSVFVALRAWVQNILGSTVEVVQQLDNRVPMPKGSFVLMNHIMRTNLGFPVASYTDVASVGTTPAVQIVSNTINLDFTIQLDCYGPLSGDWVAMLDATWMTEKACEFFDTYGVLPLYCDDPRQTTFINGENQYDTRWILPVHLQYSPVVSLSQEFASEAEVEIINVDRVYPA